MRQLIQRHLLQGTLFTSTLLVGAQAGAGTYRYEAIRLPSTQTSEATAVNDNDQVVGYFFDSTSNKHGFVWQKGVATQVDGSTPGASFTSLVAINASGLATGNYNVSDTCGLAFTYDIATGQQTPIGSCPTSQNASFYAYAASINRAGTVAGSEVGGAGCRALFCGFVARGGVIVRRISVPGTGTQVGTIVAGINDHDEVTGYYSLKNGSNEGFTFKAGTYTTFDLLNDATDPGFVTDDGTVGGSLFGDGTPQTIGFTLSGSTVASFAYPNSDENGVVGIGPAGEVVGGWGGSTGSHGFIYLNGTYYNIDFPGATQTYLSAVNAHGTLVGYYTKGTHRRPIYHAFIARCPAAEQPCTQ